MRSLIIVLLLSIVLFSGCANIKAEVPVVMPDKSVVMVKLEYTRWLNQNIDGFYLKTPSGWDIGFAKQGADNSGSISYGPFKITAGGSDE